jgi:hypothetical protein
MIVDQHHAEPRGRHRPMLSQRVWRYKLIALAALAALACLPASASDPKSLALLDVELIDDMRALSTEQARREVDRRLALIAVELAKELEARGMYRVVCNGCGLETGKAFGAERVGRCWVQKVSNLILNINIEVRSVATGETLYVKSVDIRGNTDEAWLRGVRRVVDNIEERQHHLR